MMSCRPRGSRLRMSAQGPLPGALATLSAWNASTSAST